MPDAETTDELIALGAPIVSGDGSRIRLRQGHSSDKELLLGGFARLSPESRYRRFLAPTPDLSPEAVRYLTESDHHDHEAIAAIDDAGGEGIGVARYVRDPKRPEAAEFAVTVVDDWQGKGFGTLLLDVLAGRAHTEGIRTFTALILASNQEMMDVLQAIGPVRTVDRKLGTIEIEMPVVEHGLTPALRKLLRVLARDSGATPPDGRESPAA